MQVKNIKIENYKGIVDASVEFNPQMNLFVGSNGAGKTSILEAVGICLAKFIKIVGNAKTGFKWDDNAINYKSKYANLTIEMRTDLISEESFQLAVATGLIDNNKKLQNKVINMLLQKNSPFLTDKRIHINTVPFPIVKFYSANRSLINSYNPPPSKIYHIKQLKAWDEMVFDMRSYSRFSDWFIDKETQELRMQREAGHFNIYSPELNGVRTAVTRAFEVLRGKTYYLKSTEITRAGIHKTKSSLILQEENTKEIDFLENKSDGEKTIISLISDIAYSLTIANSNTENKDFLQGKGVILIDEIEAHLHPKWQREIIPLLTQLFPNIQFFITTHSPQVVASVSSENIFVCEGFQFEKIHTKSKGTDTNTLLKHVFGVDERPKKYAKLSTKFDELVEKRNGIEKLQEVIDEVKKLEGEDPSIDINPLSEELQFRLSAYQFEMEHEAN
jgi:predicted ATP-binding protein involved in virulence